MQKIKNKIIANHVGANCVRHNNKGITLIALIITIIVMLILVAVTVAVALNGGLFTTAKNAANETQIEASKERLLSAALGALGENAEVDFTKLDANLPDGFEGSNGTYTKDGNAYKVDKYGNVTLVEPETEKVISVDDPEASYWKTDGQGTIIYYEVPEGVEVPETLIVPSKIGEEKITKIDVYALSGLRFQRNDNGTIVTELDEEGYENPVLLDKFDESGNIIPTGQTTTVKNIIISKGIESIGDYAISLCTSLKNITIPSTLKETGECIITECTVDTLKISEGATEIFDEEFAYCSIKNVILPDTITRIGDGAFCKFYHNSSSGGESILTTINIPKSVTYIGEYAFAGCTKLTEIGDTSGLVTIGRNAFDSCTSLKSIYVPETVDNMGYATFTGWTSEQTIKMGKSEEPALVGSATDTYSKIGWVYSWKYNCNANIVWGK